MQKRARAVESQKLRRTMKSRVKVSDPIRDSVSLSLAYIRLSLLWLTVISLDVLVGFRFELLWPFWLVLRAGYESFNKNHNTVVTLANQNTAKFSVFFVCVTATSDLICYLFIPIPWLIFLASTYVWVSLIWATHGGFLRTVVAVGAERSQAFPIVLLGFFVLTFEYFVRKRCDLLPIGSETALFGTYIGLNKSCDHLQGMTAVVPKNLNAFFGAHCIGYPLVLISFSLRYYFREWLIRRQKVDVSQKNEVYCKLLTEALPEVYEGPQDYSIKTIIDEECDLSLDFSSTQPMLMPPSVSTNGIHANGGSMKRGGLKPTGVRQRGSTRSKAVGQFYLPQKKNGERRRDDDENSEESEEWRENVKSYGGVSWLRLAWEAIRWIGSLLSSREQLIEDDDEDSQLEDVNKKSLRNGDLGKNRISLTQSRKGRGREKVKEKVITTHAVEREKPVNSSGVPSSLETRDSSRDTSLSQPSSAHLASSLELDRLRTEMLHSRAAEQDARIQLTVSRNNEAASKQEIQQLTNSIGRLENRYASLEKLRDVDRLSLAQLEKKYAELLNRKNDVERELIAERKARKEDGGKRSDNVEQYRERERLLERDIDRLRAEAATREERTQILEKEVYELRKYKETKENDVSERDSELVQLRERISALEASLQSENKLKQDLFRALGDARTHNAHLESKLHDASLSVSAHHQSRYADKLSPSQTLTSSALPPSYNLSVQQPKSDHHMGNFLYTALQQHHSSPTGEHVLFEQSTPTSLPCTLSPHDPLLAARMGKFGAPVNPARTN